MKNESWNPVYVDSPEEAELMRGIIPPDVPVKIVRAPLNKTVENPSDHAALPQEPSGIIPDPENGHYESGGLRFDNWNDPGKYPE